MSLRDDRGATAVMTAVLLSFVMLAVAALAVDASALYVEKRELQNAADAGALAIAENCARGLAICTADGANATAGNLANVNAGDGLSDATVTLDKAAGKVTVVTTTRTSSGTVMPSWFSGRDDNGTMRTRAVATWGSLGAHSGLSVTISSCEWQQMIASGYASDPPAATDERILLLHTTSGIGTCPAGPSGSDTPGGFGWLDHNGQCVADSTTGLIEGDPGVGLPSECKSALAAAWSSRKPLFVPVFTQVTGTGNNTVYRIAGYTAFVVTGYNLPGGSQDSWLSHVSAKNLCKGGGGNDSKCIAGYFTRAVTTGPIGGGSYGAATAKLVE